MDPFKFNVSLSVLNHLGRNLYRNVITVLGEAISNSWDANANNVFITIDKDHNRIVIRDDGDGMSPSDFQNKFLKIGYSKRKDASVTTSSRPFIGRKGIGKLALLSCANTISIISRKPGNEVVSGVIDNRGLDKAITDDVSADDYFLEPVSSEILSLYSSLEKGTAIVFDGITDGIRNRVDNIRHLLAYYFRFSVIDPDFSIYLNDSKIGIDELKPLADATQFLWKINGINDSFVLEGIEANESLKRKKDFDAGIVPDGIKGFLATVKVPSELKIRGTDEKLSVDLFVNGRLREKDILKHIPSSRIVENYLYGQIHYDGLDDEIDRFTSSREGVLSDDSKFLGFLKSIESVMRIVIDDWDKWRVEIDEEGDPDNPRLTKKQRKSKELVSAVAADFIPPKDAPASKVKVENWVKEINEDAQFNVSSYTECFLSENLLRNYIRENSLPIPSGLNSQILQWKENHKRQKESANIFFEVRESPDDLSYCDISSLASIAADPTDRNLRVSFVQDAKEYNPIRDALSHTSRLTSLAKSKLTVTYENIKARIVQLLCRA